MEIRALTRAAQILESVNANPSGVTLSQIVDAASLSKATAFRFVRALLQMQFLRLEPQTGTYYIGPALMRFGRLGQQHESMRGMARPFLEELRESTGETVTLVVPSGDQRMTVDAVLSRHELRAAPEIGGLKPIHAGAAGKAMLAWYQEETFRGLFSGTALKPVTTRTIVSLRALERDLVRVRERGYAVSSGETVFGEAASAAALFGDRGEVVGSLNVSGPTSRLPASRLRRNGELVAAAAAKLSKKLGGRKPSRRAEWSASR